MSDFNYDSNLRGGDRRFYYSLWVVGGLIAATVVALVLTSYFQRSSTSTAPSYEVPRGAATVPQLTVQEFQQYQQLRADVLKQCLTAAAPAAVQAAAHYGWGEITRACDALVNEQFPNYPVKYIAGPKP